MGKLKNKKLIILLVLLIIICTLLFYFIFAEPNNNKDKKLLYCHDEVNYEETFILTRNSYLYERDHKLILSGDFGIKLLTNDKQKNKSILDKFQLMFLNKKIEITKAEEKENGLIVYYDMNLSKLSEDELEKTFGSNVVNVDTVMKKMETGGSVCEKY